MCTPEAERKAVCLKTGENGPMERIRVMRVRELENNACMVLLKLLLHQNKGFILVPISEFIHHAVCAS
jgi:hypothetical protein